MLLGSDQVHLATELGVDKSAGKYSTFQTHETLRGTLQI